MKIYFDISGEPRGKQRHRTSGRHVYTPKQTVEYEMLAASEYKRASKGWRFPNAVPLKISILAYFQIPKSANKRTKELMEKGDIQPTKKPDCDNIVKIICDSLNEIAYHDDSQVVEVNVAKYYSYRPRVEIIITDKL